MSHPQRCGESILGGEDGRLIFGSIIDTVMERRAVGV